MGRTAIRETWQVREVGMVHLQLMSLLLSELHEAHGFGLVTL